MDDSRAIETKPTVATRAVQASRLNAIRDLILHQVRTHRTLIRTLLRFALVGGTGYLLYQAILFAVYDSSLLGFLPAKDTKATIVFLTHGDVRLLITTLIATAVVLAGVFTGHNLWTFRDRNAVRKPIWLRFGQFAATALIASAIVTVTVNVLVLQFDTYHFVALPIGVALAGVWDWLSYTQLIWRRGKPRSRWPIVLTTADGAARLTAIRGLILRQAHAHRTLLRFAAVGGLGYVIYTSVLLLLYDLSALPFLPSKDTSVDLLLFTHNDSLLLITTLIGTQASIIGVFIGHSLWTFTDWQTVRKPLWLRFLQFEARALASTLGILTVAVNGVAVGLGVHPFVGVPVGLVAAFTWNWLWDTKFIWRKRGVSQ